MSYLGYLERLPAAIVIAGEVAMVPIVVTIVTVVPIAMPIMPAGHGHRNQAAGEEDADQRGQHEAKRCTYVASYLTRSDWRSALVVPAPVASVVIACSVGKGEAGKVSRTNSPPTTDPPTVATRKMKTLIQVFRLSLIIFHLIPPTWMLLD
jgi:hypothetical protein